MMKILVTGDRGYIGSVLVPLLIKSKYEVLGIDSGFFENNILDKTLEPKYKKITKDIRKISPSDLKGVWAVIHLSALSNDPTGEINPALTLEINYKASVKLARLAKRAGVKKFIFSSSCSIYGIAKNGIVDEKSKVNPLTAYAKSKIKTEKALKNLADKDFNVYILRNSTVYGFSRRFRNDLVVNNLVTSALAYGQIRIQSDGTPWRPLIDVRDLSNIFIEFLKTKNPKLNGLILNIGFNENNFQIKDIANIVNRFLPECEISYTGEHGTDSRSYKVNFDLFRHYFPNQVQEWPLEKSVKDLIENLTKYKFGKKVLESGKFTRLAVIRDLLENKIVDKNLYR